MRFFKTDMLYVYNLDKIRFYHAMDYNDYFEIDSYSRYAENHKNDTVFYAVDEKGERIEILSEMYMVVESLQIAFEHWLSMPESKIRMFDFSLEGDDYDRQIQQIADEWSALGC